MGSISRVELYAMWIDDGGNDIMTVIESTDGYLVLPFQRYTPHWLMVCII